MGTRGFYGLQWQGEKKLGYCHWDSYPQGLGADVVKFCMSQTRGSLLRLFERIVIVGYDSPGPTQEQIVACAPYTDLRVSNQSLYDWYCLTNKAQGDLSALTGDFVYMYEDNGDGEYGYVINLDTDCLDFYNFRESDVAASYSLSSLREMQGAVDDMCRLDYDDEDEE